MIALVVIAALTGAVAIAVGYLLGDAHGFTQGADTARLALLDDQRRVVQEQTDRRLREYSDDTRVRLPLEDRAVEERAS